MNPQRISGLHDATGKWIELSTFDPEETSYDAVGWLENLPIRMMDEGYMLPCGALVNLTKFAAFKDTTK